jgi:hypothetical protein
METEFVLCSLELPRFQEYMGPSAEIRLGPSTRCGVLS